LLTQKYFSGLVNFEKFDLSFRSKDKDPKTDMNKLHAKLRCILILVGSFVFHPSVSGQIITTVSGNYYATLGFSGDGGPASYGQFNHTKGIAMDPSGNIFIADQNNQRIREVNTSNIVSTYAGNGISGNSGDNGVAINAEISLPEAVTTDKFGNLFIADNNSVVRKVDAITKIITTIAGNGTGGFSGDGGPATSAQLNNPMGMAVDNSGNLFIVDNSNNSIRRVDAVTGIITTYAGNQSSGYSGDGGPAVSAQLNDPEAIALDATGNLYIADGNNNCIRRVDNSSKQITTIAGNGTAGSIGDGSLATLAQLSFPTGVFMDGPGNIYISDHSNRIRVINNSTGIISTIAGNGTAGFSGDGGPATSASLSTPLYPVVASTGDIYFPDYGNDRIRKINSQTGVISTFAGNYLRFGGDGGPASSAVFLLPIDVKFDNSGNLLIADMDNDRIRKIDASTKVITTIIGNGVRTFAGDGGLASAASIHQPQDMAVDNAGNIYVADLGNNRVRKVDAVSGIITTAAGNGLFDVNGRGGLAINAGIAGPQGVAVDKNGNLFIAEWLGPTILKVDAVTHIISVVAGSTGIFNYTGDGGLATNASLYFPWSVAVDNQGNLYIADLNNNAIRRVDAITNIITTIAGTGVAGSTGDGGLASAALINGPWKVILGPSNSLYVSESNRLRKIDLNTGIITAFAGTGVSGYSGDGGSPLLAKLDNPTGLTFDGAGNAYIADYQNNVIREIVSNPLPTKLLSFEGYLDNNDETVLKWRTVLEDGTSYYDLLYSTDGAQYSFLAQIKANGEPSIYSYLHCCPHSGNNYYQLKMVDQDGEFSFSKIVLVKYNPDGPGLKIFPNPSSDLFTLEYPVTKKKEIIRIMNTNGSLIKSIEIPSGSREKTLSLKGFPKGIYFVQFSGNSDTEKLILR
jgi:streptogramin lyase